MNYTKSNSYTEHAGTGQRMHDAGKAIPTQVSDSDLNMIIWSLMEVIKAAGLQGMDFSADNPESYRLLLRAIQIGGAHTHPDATAEASGFMSAADKEALSRLTIALAGCAPLRNPVFTKENNDTEGGQIALQAADNQQLWNLNIDFYQDCLRFFTTRKSDGGLVGAQINFSRIASGFFSLIMPAGSILLTAASAPPEGYLAANGAAVSRTAYADLFGVISTAYGAGDGVSTFNLPDLRGEFLRGWDAGRGVDAGRAIGSAQGDAIRNIVASLTGPVDVPLFSAVSGALFLRDRIRGRPALDSSSHEGMRNLLFDASRVVPTAGEVRPRNVALLACIKY